MTSTQELGNRSVAGFSLLEMLVVMTVLALVAAIALPQLTRPSDTLRLQTVTRELYGALRVTRSAAIARGTDIVLVIDTDDRTFGSSVVPLKTFAVDIVAQLKVAEPERITSSRGGFRFFADGTSTGGDLVLHLRDQEAKICVNWLTGEALSGPSC